MNYAANVEGLPKTDFETMRAIGSGILNTTHVPRMHDFLSSGGLIAGTQMVGVLVNMEKALASVNFNAFDLPGPVSVLTETFEDAVRKMVYVYLVRAAIRQRDLPVENTETFRPLMPDTSHARALLSSLVDLAQQKDREYGASWCKRGGIGAWFTTVRKFDRMITQLNNKGNDIWNVSDEAGSTESLEETIKDGINYLMLILEKRSQIAGKLRV